ncbi:MAG: ABC-F family ATP-binding cassette domain-containing protein [Balneola sp.]|nr:ABC-F family ATP-binding cassette domain-containing protein [Balneola sp.]MBO6649949.1 ABC-F family ATP-binding cassette domain-containing protein [Balneola sp.]MBO6711703.1 ABC-F family ATP-binding cassette domain-containing protein [Balneola sp.]MBO6799897.1 ABC-F family ATP-binding cassette domain-containing protein [Balneola sp.]MBO6871142.1 ABC-F family ATP-binding cassette domain-containing protein [Balneola sp.]
MTYLSTENLGKKYGLKLLFEDLTFGISKGDKTALIAQNGVGKSTLLKILAGKEVPDSGEVMIRNGIKVAILEQEPELDDSMTINQFISHGENEMVKVVQQYEKAVAAQAENYNEKTQEAFDKALAKMDAANAWDYEQRLHQILSVLNIHDLDQHISSLSGGQRKRVALAFALLDDPDLLILDEPTNHLDVEMIEWLEAYLTKSTMTLLMVTHDRYFLDRVCNHILEIEDGQLYHHKGNYEYFLQKKAEREEVYATEIAKAGKLMKKEQEWMRRQPKARTTKSKSRIDAFYQTEKKAKSGKVKQEVKLEVDMSRIGGQVLELKKVSKSFDDLVILKDFEYSFNKGERIGIIGKNGVGKSTFLKIITGEEPVDSGKVETGQTIVYGHYKQSGIQIKEKERVIDVIKEIAEVIVLANGDTISVSQFLEHFMFDSKMQYTPVSKLSGGEKRRLGLMMVLIKNPNFLILDEPTNDLDLITLEKLEDFLSNFGGCLIIVSHDRYFMDNLVEHYFVFEGNGVVNDFNGTYSEYRALKTEQESGGKNSSSEKKKSDHPKPSNSDPQKLSFNERKEYQKLEKEIEELEKKKSAIHRQMSNSDLDYEKLQELSETFSALKEELEEKEFRWLELAERA